MLEHLVIIFAIISWTAVNIVEYNHAYKNQDTYNNTMVFNLTDLHQYDWSI